MLAVETPFVQFYELDGSPLSNGSVYFGAPNQNPETSPLVVYWDAAGTQPAAQPIKTINGYLSRAGSPAIIYTVGDYSVTTRDNRGRLVITSPSSTSLANALASNDDPTKGAGLVGFSYDQNYATGTIGARAKTVGIDVTQPPFSCDKTGVEDCSVAFNIALTTYPGIPLYFPAGVYRCDSTISIKPASSWGVFGPGVSITGDGPGSTFFDNRVANGPLFDIDSATHGGTYSANLGTRLSGFQIMTTTSPAASIGIRVLNVYQLDISQLVIKGMTAHGIELKNGAYTDDGWNRVNIRQCWIELCAGWGIKADGTAGRNEGSYTYLEQVFFQTCGTADGGLTPPTSGAMIWKGQILTMEQVAAANGNQNVAFYFKGESGLGQTVDMRNSTSENTYGWGVYCDGIDVFKGRNNQLYNNTVFTCATQCEFAGPTYTVRQVDWDGGAMRAAGLNMAGSVTGTVLTITGLNSVTGQAIVVGSKIYGTGVTAGTAVISFGTGTGGTGTYNLSASSAATGAITIKGRPTTAFKISGGNAVLDTCRVRNIAWENFDFPDQIRFNGWQFDQVPDACELAVVSTTSVVLRPRAAVPGGNKTPHRLAGGSVTASGGVASVTGELVALEIPTGLGGTLAGLPAAATRYYCYLYDVGGVPTLELSTTAYVKDTGTGLSVKTGDASRIYKGSVATDATPLFLTANTGWLNPTPIAGSQGGTYAWMWYSGTSAALRRTLATLPTSDTDGALV